MRRHVLVKMGVPNRDLSLVNDKKTDYRIKSQRRQYLPCKEPSGDGTCHDETLAGQAKLGQPKYSKDVVPSENLLNQFAVTSIAS